MDGLGSILHGEYLTPECKDCPEWVNDEHTIGCATHQPIDQCPAFRRAYEEKMKMLEGGDKHVC